MQQETKFYCIAQGTIVNILQGFPDSSVGKESVCNAGDPGSIPGLGRSSGERKGYPLQQNTEEFQGLYRYLISITYNNLY